jgi:hypothetical protein
MISYSSAYFTRSTTVQSSDTIRAAIAGARADVSSTTTSVGNIRPYGGRLLRWRLASRRPFGACETCCSRRIRYALWLSTALTLANFASPCVVYFAHVARRLSASAFPSVVGLPRRTLRSEGYMGLSISSAAAVTCSVGSSSIAVTRCAAGDEVTHSFLPERNLRNS